MMGSGFIPDLTRKSVGIRFHDDSCDYYKR
jgi:hypothetical protein